MPSHIDMTGQRYGRLVAIRQIPNDKRNMPTWRFKCDCGAEVTKLAGHVRQGRTLSCGCLRREMARAMATKHGGHGGANYKLWLNMWGRCTRPDSTGYERYGGRGIKVCERWRDFNLFIADMGPRPSGYTIERVDNDGNYEPNNCRWATRQEQVNNRSITRWVITEEGRISLADYARSRGLLFSTLANRFMRATKGHEIDAKLLEARPRQETLAAMSAARRAYWQRRRLKSLLPAQVS